MRYEEAIDPSTGQIIMVPVLEEPAETQDIQQAQQTQTQPPLVVSPTGEYTEVIDPITGLPMPVPVNPTPLPPEPEPPTTVNYPTVDDWRKAGSPSTTPDTRITIGEGGESGAYVTNPVTGQKAVVPFEEYKPYEATTYVPTRQMYDIYSKQYQNDMQQFDDKWKDLIKDDKFTGTTEQYEQYVREYGQLEDTARELIGQAQILTEEVNRQRAKQEEFENKFKQDYPDLYELYKTSPEKFKQEIEKLNREAIVSQERYDRYENAIHRLSVYKQSDGTYNIVEYLKVRPIDFSNREEAINSPQYKLLSDAGFTFEQIQLANFHAQDSGKYSISPSEAPRPNWFDKKAIQLQVWMEDLRQGQMERQYDIPFLNEATTENLKRMLDGVAGVTTGAVTMFPMAALFLGQAATHPTQLPNMAKNMFYGFIDMAKTAVNPLAPSYDIANSVFNIGMMADIGTGALKKITTFIHERGLPQIGFAGEVNTGRISLKRFDTPDGRLRGSVALGEHLKKLTEVGDNDIIRTSVKAADGTELEFVSIKTPLQQQVGNIIIHADNKGLKFVERENLPLDATGSGLEFINTGTKSLDTGRTVIGDLHESATGVIDDINSGHSSPIITPDGNWTGTKQTVIQLGDIVDRGSNNNIGYFNLRDMFNRLHDQANTTNGNVVRVIGNHELAYIMNDSIRGVRYMNRDAIRMSILDDINTGKAVAAYADAKGNLYTHAGVALDKFPEWKGKTADYIANDINTRFKNAVQSNNFTDPIFDRGRVEA